MDIEKQARHFPVHSKMSLLPFFSQRYISFLSAHVEKASERFKQQFPHCLRENSFSGMLRPVPFSGINASLVNNEDLTLYPLWTLKFQYNLAALPPWLLFSRLNQRQLKGLSWF
jgi:hypothetical protein